MEPNAALLLRDALRLVFQTQPRSVSFSFGGCGKMRPPRGAPVLWHFKWCV